MSVQKTEVTAAQALGSLVEIIRSVDREASRFVTSSGVTGFVATGVSSELIGKLRSRLEGKLRRTGHIGQ